MAVSEFDEAWQAVAECFEEQFGKTLTYKRGAVSCQITATLGSHAIRHGSELGWDETWHGHVWIVRAASLVINAQVVLPEKGDQIIEPMAGGKQKRYVVVKTPEGRTYDPFDAEEYQLAVYTLVLSENEPE